jgi:hypothetical protein
MAGRWVDVGEAARELGISTDAVRKRIARGSLESDRPNGSVLVWLDEGGTEAGREAQLDGGPLVEELREQVSYLQGVIETRDRELALRAEEIRRRDSALEREQQLTAFFAERLRELEAPAPHTAPEPEETREDAPQSPESPGRSDTPPDRGGGSESATDEQQGRGPIPDAGGPQEATERRWWEFWR